MHASASPARQRPSRSTGALLATAPLDEGAISAHPWVMMMRRARRSEVTSIEPSQR